LKAEVLNNISRVAPNYSLRLPGVKITVASGTVSGTASAKLVRTGSPDLTSTAAVKNNNTSFTYTFDFSQAAAGVYDVACADASQFTGILKQAFSILLPVVSPVAWSMHDLGQAGTQTNINNVCGLAIGDANGDNLQELYVGNQDQNLYKFTWDNSSWTCIAQTVAASQTFGRVLLADGNNNTGWQVYAGTVASNHLYSCSASWATQDIGAAYAGTAKITALASADIYNEGFTRIYAAATDGISKYGLSQFQYQYDGVTWTASDIYYPPSQANDLVAGDGNNDGTVKLYSANSGGSIYQYTVSGSTWTMGVVDTGTDIMYGVAVGDGANLGNNQVYAACKNGKLYQFRWNGSWSNQAIGQAVGNTLYAVAVSDADNDGANEVYAACGDGHVYEFKYQGTTWKTLDLGNAGTPLYTLAVGDADNDHQFEVYALGQNNHVYQFKAGLQGTATPTPVVTPTPGAPMPTTFLKINHSQINPNHGEQAVIRWIQPQNGPVTITIYNLLGDKVATLVSSQTFPAGQFNQVDWNGHTQAGKTAGSGIYILQLQAPGYQAISKVAVVK
jgi:hypothetical protein